MKLYEKTLMFRRGTMLQLNLTYACPFHCTYCSVDMVKGYRPKTKSITLEEWKQRAAVFPTKIR